MTQAIPPGAAILARIVPAIFGCIGVAVLVFLWSAEFGKFGSPPLFFRVFGSFIAVVFCLVGFGGAIFGPRAMQQARPARRRRDRLTAPLVEEEPAASRVGYDCPNCGSTLDSGADVSPKGDAKCSYCDRWFNIHETA